MLPHVTPEELERNRAALSEPWNLDEPIEDLWAKIANIQRVATLGHVPIPDITVITLTLAMLEKTGLLATTTEKFRLRPIDEWSLNGFKAEFKLGNQERVRKLTAGDAGYHGAHQTSLQTPLPPVAATPLSRLCLHQQYLSTSPSTAAKCTTAGRTDWAPTGITPPPRATTKLRAIRTMLPPSK